TIERGVDIGICAVGAQGLTRRVLVRRKRKGSQHGCDIVNEAMFADSARFSSRSAEMQGEYLMRSCRPFLVCGALSAVVGACSNEATPQSERAAVTAPADGAPTQSAASAGPS